jgi:hypothetical protein
MSRRKIRIVYDGEGAPYKAKITDSQTGDVIPNVARVEIALDAKKSTPVAILHVLSPILDIVVDAEMHSRCRLCGKTSQLSEDEINQHIAQRYELKPAYQKFEEKYEQ